jgi:peptidoglycan/LPS O-acetylase OafA/YrhL
LVFLHHSPIPKSNFLHYFTNAGGVGVSFFFVLSGFLITYILILEKLNHDNKVPLKKFFLRRILRIWPLYYAMVLFAFCTPFILNLLGINYSNQGYQPNWFFTLTFLENYVMMYKNEFPNVSPLIVMWSLCIEEHFYIIWGLIFYFISLKNVPKLIISSILLAFVSTAVYQTYNIPTSDILTNIHYFAFGAIPAYLFVFRKDFISKLEMLPGFYKYLYAVFVVIAVVVCSSIPIITDEKYSSIFFGLLFSVLILFTLGKINVFKISDSNLLAKLGKYTYGLYLIHTVCINFFIKMAPNFKLNWVAITLLSFFSTLLLSFLSYHLFEKQFLKLKKRHNSSDS